MGMSAMEEFHRYPLRVQQSKLDGWWFIFLDEVCNREGLSSCRGSCMEKERSFSRRQLFA